MSQAPSTFGTITTSSLSPISVTSVVRSSSTQGLSSELIRVQSAVLPKSDSLAALISPWRAASLRSTGIASSRLPSRMSVFSAIAPALATIFSFEKSRKWIIRDGVTGISRSGSGAPIACGWKKSLGFLKTLLGSLSIWGTRESIGHAVLSAPSPFAASKARKLRGMESAERDDTQDWLLPEGAAPPLLSELEGRIDEALIIAKASEKAVMAVGDAALDAAQQARRAAEMAERAAEAALNATPAPAAVAYEDVALRNFSERADRVVARLRAV